MEFYYSKIAKGHFGRQKGGAETHTQYARRKYTDHNKLTSNFILITEHEAQLRAIS